MTEPFPGSPDDFMNTIARLREANKALVEALKLSLFQTQCRIEILERCETNDGAALQQAIKARDAGFVALKAAGVK